jgi:hypothetical protein
MGWVRRTGQKLAHNAARDLQLLRCPSLSHDGVERASLCSRTGGLCVDPTCLLVVVLLAWLPGRLSWRRPTCHSECDHAACKCGKSIIMYDSTCTRSMVNHWCLSSHNIWVLLKHTAGVEWHSTMEGGVFGWWWPHPPRRTLGLGLGLPNSRCLGLVALCPLGRALGGALLDQAVQHIFRGLNIFRNKNSRHIVRISVKSAVCAHDALEARNRNGVRTTNSARLIVPSPSWSTPA